MKRLTDEVIIAAVGGDEEAMSKVLAHYAPMIRKYSGGNENMKRYITEGLRESILHYNLNDPQKNEEYLRQRYPQEYGH